MPAIEHLLAIADTAPLAQRRKLLTDMLVDTHRARRSSHTPALDFVAELPLALLGSINVPAMTNLARVSDRWGGHAYHSTHHHVEVATHAVVLASLSGCTADEMSLLAAAALGHDLRYQACHHFAAFEQERGAAEEAIVHLARADAGLAPERKATLRSLILSTEPSARAWLRHSAAFWRQHLPSGWASGKLELCDRTHALACILSDADLLSSAGLTLEYADEQSRLLARELGKDALSPAARWSFMSGIVGGGFLSQGGQVFDANRQLIVDHVSGGSIQVLEAAE